MAEENNQQQQPQQGQTGLTINDLHTMATIIETCSERGAFEAKELTAVGAVYNKLMAFLAAQSGNQPGAASDTPPANSPPQTKVEDQKE